MIDYTSSYQAAFDKAVSLIFETFAYSRRRVEVYFQATMLMNIGSKYSNLVTTIPKDWKDDNTNLPETTLQIIQYFVFMKEARKTRIFEPPNHFPHPNALPKAVALIPNVEKGLTTHYTDCCWVKHPELRPKFPLGKMRTRNSQRNLKTETPMKTEAITKRTR